MQRKPLIRRARLARIGLAGLVGIFILFGLRAGPVTAVGLSQSGANPEPDTVRFAAATIDKSLPAGALAETDLRLWGGGYPGCLTQPLSPTLDYNTGNLDLTGIAFLATCGWQPDEIIRVTVMDPEGKIFTSQVKAIPARLKKEVYQADIYFQPGIDAPAGPYRFTLEGSVTLKTKVFFNRPQAARLYALPADRFSPIQAVLGGKHRLRLDSFLPGEPVRLLAYTFAGSRIQFYGWQDYTTDRLGRLIVETDLPDVPPGTEMLFYAYGRDTHSVALERFTRDGLNKTRQFNLDLYCPGALTPRLNGAGQIQPAGELKLYQQPGFGSRTTASIPVGTQMRLFGYPRCIDRAYWWQVWISDPVLFGWVPESYLGQYQVELVLK